MKKTKRQLAREAGYDSFFEYELALGPLYGANYHPDKIPYVIQKEYEPDFEVNGILVETKGRFRPGDTLLYRTIFETLREQGRELVFCFAKPDLPLPGAQKRKDQTKRSHAEWAEGIGARWFSPETIGELWK